MERVALVVVPDSDDPSCADVLVDATVGGRPYRLVLDTGAAHTISSRTSTQQVFR